MRLICIEEHTVDGDIRAAAGPALEREAPYLDRQLASGTGDGSSADRPVPVRMDLALERAQDLGAGRIAAMDAHGIDMQVVSYSSPAQLVPDDDAVRLTRAANDRLAAAAAAHPDRLAGFAVLPWQHPQAAADELERAVRELGMCGALIVGRPGATFFDDPRQRPALERAAALGVPLYLHPFAPLPQVQEPYYGGFADEVSATLSLAGWGWHHEAGVHVLRMILGGVFERIPGLQVISGHWGEMVPWFLPRLDDALPARATGLSGSISEVYREHVWITPSGMFHAGQLAFVRDVVGLDRVIWSVDHPYLTMDGTRAFLDGADLTDDERHAVTHGNAEAMLGL
ncbi:amidohydrolase family protein [Actinomycetospora sp. C-140]